jgi:hypothetical protein
MPGPLASEMMEAFARAVAQGMGTVEAYKQAGYAPFQRNAFRLRTHKRVAARIDELTAQKLAETTRQTVTAAEKAGVDAFFVMRNLRRNAIMSMRHGDRAAANRALEIIAKHLGMLIERKEIAISYIDDADEYLAKMMKLIEGEVHEVKAITNGGIKDGSDPAKTTDIEE